MSEEILHPEMNTEIKKSPANIAFKWALIATLMHVIYTMTMIYLDGGRYEPRPEGWYHMVIGLIILFFPMTMCIKEFRDKEMEGYISFGKAFKSGFAFSLILMVLIVLFQMVLYNFIIDWDTFLSEQMDKGMKVLKERGMSSEDIQKQMSKSPAFLSTQWFSLLSLSIVLLIFYTIATLVVAAILKRNRPANA